MKKSQLEERVYRIIDRVRLQQPIEDDNVELKTEWITPQKAARRLAGHANSSGGEPILWVMGINEKFRAIPGVNPGEFSDWLNGLQSNFDEGVSPELLLHVNVPHENVTVVAMYFETDRAPYLVKNPKGGEITADVPWRKGTYTHSARRSQLLRLLGPISRLPKVDVLRAVLAVRSNLNTGNPERAGLLEWQLDLDLYFVLASREPVVIPKWSTLVFLDVPGELERKQCAIVEYMTRYASPVEHAAFNLRVNETGVASFMLSAYSAEKLQTNRDQVSHVALELTPHGSDRKIHVSIALRPSKEIAQGLLGCWVFRKSTNDIALLL